VAAGRHYDAVLMDVQMPVMDGLEATRALRRRREGASLPIIAMTANAMDNDREACMDAGMNQHVAKPFAINDVVAVILQCIAPPPDAPARGAASEPPIEDLPVFDRADALRRMGGDEDLLRSVLPVFRSNLEDALRGLDAASGPDLARLMHSVKGMAANVSAKALAAQAAAAEQVIRAVSSAESVRLVAQVRQAIEAVLREIGG
jgi:CheY-like chemotaxis protein